MKALRQKLESSVEERSEGWSMELFLEKWKEKAEEGT